MRMAGMMGMAMRRRSSLPTNPGGTQGPSLFPVNYGGAGTGRNGLAPSGSEPPAIGTYPHEPNDGGLFGPFTRIGGGTPNDPTSDPHYLPPPVIVSGNGKIPFTPSEPTGGQQFPYGVNSSGVPYAGRVPNNSPYGANRAGVPYAGPVQNPRQFVPSMNNYAPNVWNPFMRIGSQNVFGGTYEGLMQDPIDNTYRTVFTPGGSSRFGGFGAGMPSFANIGGAGRISFNRVLPNGQVVSSGAGGGGLGNPPVNYQGQNKV